MAEDLIPVRQFNELGITRVRNFLAKVRTEGKLSAEEASEILVDTEYVDSVGCVHEIDRYRVFETKRDLCDYVVGVFGLPFIEANRKNVGLWTWVAFAYYAQFVKSSKDVSSIASTPRWILDADNYRLSVRHFVAGPLYLKCDFSEVSEEAIDMIFSSPPKEFGGFVDALTYKMDGARIPVLLQVATWLYYDASSKKKLKKGVISQTKPGAIREFLRVASQLALTWDFYSVKDASALWNVLPSQFDEFKQSSYKKEN
ncbi:MAG: hypothetical protein Q4G65_16895 [bacterium]|nr:hypothetical protein [bacterium]